MTAPAASVSPFAAWVDHFARNPVRQQRIEADVDWAAPVALPPTAARAIARSFQRFELGESGDGTHLLGLAARRGDPAYTESVRLLIAEEQRHSALFGRGLRHLGAPSLRGHWSDRVFTALRRSLGLDTEIALFLVAETIALDYFEALAAHPQDPVVAAIGRRIVLDEREHVRFQIDRLHLDLRGLPAPQRLAIGMLWGTVAVGAATVLAAGHAGALQALGRRPLAVWARGLRCFRSAAVLVLTGDPARVLGPSTPDPEGDSARSRAVHAP